MEEKMLVLIAGPYRSGTNDNQDLMQKNLELLEETSLSVWRKGHLPVIGEWIALPLMRRAGSQSVGDAVYTEIAYPVAHQLLRHCDAVMRVGGESRGADQDVALARRLGLKIFFSIDELPTSVSPKGGA
jgi:hypothetical protein